MPWQCVLQKPQPAQLPWPQSSFWDEGNASCFGAHHPWHWPPGSGLGSAAAVRRRSDERSGAGSAVAASQKPQPAQLALPQRLSLDEGKAVAFLPHQPWHWAAGWTGDAGAAGR